MKLIKYTCLLVLIVSLSPFFSAQAHANDLKKVVLIIGNGDYNADGDYSDPGDLIATQTDVRSMEQVFRNELRFDRVIVARNLNRRDFRSRVREFRDASKDADVAVFYFSGHGVVPPEGSASKKQNYLVPIGIDFDDQDVAHDLEGETISLSYIRRLVERPSLTTVYLLDACRNSPFNASLSRTISGQVGKSVSVRKGLYVPPINGVESFIAFAAGAGEVSIAPTNGDASYFTQALMQHLSDADSLQHNVSKVRGTVLSLTDNEQRPQSYGELNRPLYLGDRPLPGRTVVVDSPFWEKISADDWFVNGAKSLLNTAIQQESASELLVAATNGSINASVLLARAHQDGLHGFGKDQILSRSILKKNCRKGRKNYDASCVALGQMILGGLGGPKDYVQAKELLRDNCSIEFYFGCPGLMRIPNLKLSEFPVSTAEFSKISIELCERKLEPSDRTCLWLASAFKDAEWMPNYLTTTKVLLKSSCDKNNAIACGSLAEIYDSKRASLTDHKIAYQLFKKGCDLNSGWSCNRLAVKYSNGEGIRNSKGDLTQAALYHREACSLDYQNSCVSLGDLIMAGYMIPENHDAGQMLVWLNASCDAGNPNACKFSTALDVCAQSLQVNPWVDVSKLESSLTDVLGCIQEKFRNTKSVDTQDILSLSKENCSNGSAVSCTSAGNLMMSIGRTSESNQQASILFATACGGGDLEGCQKLGRLYYDGDGVPKDIDASLSYSKQACDGGHSLGCLQLASIYMGPQPLDYHKARRFFSDACSLGNQDGCAEFGALMHHGLGGERNSEQGLQLIRAACRTGAKVDNCKTVFTEPRQRPTQMAPYFELPTGSISRKK